GQDRAAPGLSALGDADRGIGGNYVELNVGLNDPAIFRVGVDQVIDLAVVLNRRSQVRPVRLPQVSSANERQAVRSLGISQRAAQSGIAVGIVAVVPAKRGREVLSYRLVDLHAAGDGVFLVPQQATFDVH